jgi:hypothetical protein
MAQSGVGEDPDSVFSPLQHFITSAMVCGYSLAVYFREDAVHPCPEVYAGLVSHYSP